MKTFDEIKKILPYWKKYGVCYASEITVGDSKGSVVFCDNENGLEHVSFAPYSQKTPTWDQMCELKDIFWNDDEEVVQVHPKKSQYVNIKSNCLHLWRNPHSDYWNVP